MTKRLIIIVLSVLTSLLIPKFVSANNEHDQSQIAYPTERQLIKENVESLKVTSAYTPPISTTISVYWLNPNDGSRFSPPTLCTFGNLNYGCTGDPDYGGYPYLTNPKEISIDNDYLLNVVSSEMSPSVFNSTALTSQAIAARTFTYFFHRFNLPLANDASTSQVFLPRSFEAVGSPTLKDKVEQAVGVGRYLSYIKILTVHKSNNQQFAQKMKS